MSKEFVIAPSILAADFANLEKELRLIQKAGAQWAHIDVMDGHFVPNLTLGAPIIQSLRPVTELTLDVHLMIENPEKYVEDFAKAGSDFLTIHVESTNKVKETLLSIKELGMKAGISLKPNTPVKDIETYLPYVDLVLVMSVEPGFGGQSFMKEQIEKAERLKDLFKKMEVPPFLEIDGGINAETFKFCKNFDVLVAGSYVFKKEKGMNEEELLNLYKSRIDKIKYFCED